MFRFTSLSVLVLTGGMCFADQFTLGTPHDGNCVPFNCNDSGSGVGAVVRYQQVFDSRQFASPILITGLTFFDQYLPSLGLDNVSLLNGTYVFSLSITTVGVGGLSSSLTSNITSTQSLFLSTSSAGLAAGFASVSFTGIPFLWDPVLGNLLLDISVTDQPDTSGSFLIANGFDADDSGLVTSRAYQIGQLSGADNTGLVTQLDYINNPSQSTPEPATLVMVSGGLAALLCWRKYKSVAGGAVALLTCAGFTAIDANAQSTHVKVRTIAIPLHRLGAQGPRQSFRGSAYASDTSTPVASAVSNIPTFTRSNASGQTTFVGTDPATTNSTSVIPVPVIPIILILSDGTTFNPAKKLNTAPVGSALSALLATITSPIFQLADYVNGGTYVGQGVQYGDAIQRATFWDSVGTSALAWHIRLQYRLQPAITLNVPSDVGTVAGSTAHVDNIWLSNQLDSLAPSYGVSTFPLFLLYNTVQLDNGGNCCVLGYHTALELSSGSIQTYAAATYLDPFQVVGGASDVSALTQVVGRWLNNPLVSNFVTPWPTPFSFIIPGPPYDDNQCQTILESSQPINDRFDPAQLFFTLITSGRSYTLANQVLAPWFLRYDPSPSVNGSFTFLPVDSEFSHSAPLCGRPAASNVHR